MSRQSITHPEVTWGEGDTPSATAFNDIYYNSENALSDVTHVFLQGIDAPAIWRDKELCTIAETGFGTGLNFLATWALWATTATHDARLHFYSTEAFPLHKDDLRRALAAFPILADQTEELINAWPPMEPGFHTLDFAGGRVRLTLMLGDAATTLPLAHFKADAWYLDGFAPSKNPLMWGADIMAEIARLSHNGTRLATFSAAGNVKRGLEDVGFRTKKAEGFGRKRERILATFEGPTPAPTITRPRVAIIGGGIAGCHLAHELHNVGATPVLFEAGPQLGMEASGNLAALIVLRFTLGNDTSCRIHNLAFWDAVRLYDQFEREHGGLWLAPRGVRKIAKSQDEADRHAKLVSHYGWDKDQLYLDGDDLIMPSGGCLRPKRLLELLTLGLDVRLNTPIARVEGATLYDANNDIIDNFDHVVFAMGAKAYALTNALSPMGLVRGQVSLIKADPLSEETLLFGHYVSPEVEGVHVVGATYQRERMIDDDWVDLTDDDHAQCLNALKAVRPTANIELLGGRANLRAATTDRLPVMGAVGDKQWMMSAFGSRGFQMASHTAKALAAHITSGPLPIETDLAASIRLKRFS